MSKDYIVVTTVQTFRHRYVMHKDDLRQLNTEATPNDLDLADWALDTVTCEECQEFSQEWMGEQIMDTYECDEDEILTFFDRDNGFLKYWSKEKKIAWVRKNLKNPD